MYQFPLWLIILIGLITICSSNFEIVEAPPLGGKTHYASPYEHGPPTAAAPHDFPFPDSIAHIIAKQLIELNETEIKDYPLTDLPPEDIKAVFTLLNPGNLSKVLLNIDDGLFKNIYNKSTPMTFDKMIQNISESDRNKIQKRVK
jgi:hypothetical protein